MTLFALVARMKRTALIVLLWGGSSVLTPLGSLFAGTATLAWDPSAGTNVIANYKIYYGTASRTYTNAASAGAATTLSISNLVGGITYYFSATAVDTSGLESDYSVEASALIPASKPPSDTTFTPISVVTAPNAVLSIPIGSSLVNTGQLTFSFDPGAPASASINATSGLFSWTVPSTYAMTTNSFNIRIVDATSPQQMVQPMIIVVQDYLEVALASTNTTVGKTVSMPVTLSSSSGVTNLSFAIPWPSGRFTNATLSSLASGIASGTVQSQGANMVVNVRTRSGRSLTGSLRIANLNFQTVASQQSAIVPMPINSVTAMATNGHAYNNCGSRAGQVIVMGSAPFLTGDRPAGLSRALTLYGNVGASYQLQSNTNGLSPTGWQPVASYLQTNLPQTILVTSPSPQVFYRLLAQ
jgi:hypothetical protein